MAAKPQNRLHHRVERLILFMILALVLYWLGFAAAAFIIGEHETTEPADVIIVLGSGLRKDGQPGPALRRRTWHAADLWQKSVAPLVLCTGGQSEYYPRTEADACREMLQAAGLPADAILTEERSRSTEENAIYSKQILDERQLTRVVLVSDSYHMLRARWIFSLKGLQTFASPVPAERMRDARYYLSSLLREFIAFNWQLFKELFNIPWTHVRGI
jgi:uncharacterized SAM-binding protein YcdF (DUF218 family)